MTALTNAILAQPCVNKSRPENLEYRPKILGNIPKKFLTSRKFNFITSCLSRNFSSLLIPGKVFWFPEEFCCWHPLSPHNNQHVKSMGWRKNPGSQWESNLWHSEHEVRRTPGEQRPFLKFIYDMHPAFVYAIHFLPCCNLYISSLFRQWWVLTWWRSFTSLPTNSFQRFYLMTAIPWWVHSDVAVDRQNLRLKFCLLHSSFRSYSYFYIFTIKMPLKDKIQKLFLSVISTELKKIENLL